MNNDKSNLIAPCGMNCELCISYIFSRYDLNKLGFHRKYCDGCIKRGLNCTFSLGNKCKLIKNGEIRFCYECNDYPCEGLKRLDKRYRTKYNLSMIENLNYIKKNGIEKFNEKERNKWQCKKCNELICCHTNICLNCDISKYNKK